MEDDEILSKLTKLRNNSLKGKFKRLFESQKITPQEIRYMRNLLKTKVKPMYLQFIAQRSESNPEGTKIDELTIKFYDENIERLPDELIIELYERYEIAIQIPESPLRYGELLMLFASISLSYSWKGWFRQKIIPYLK